MLRSPVPGTLIACCVRRLLAASLLLCLNVGVSVAVEPVQPGESQLSGALTAWRQGDLDGARGTLSGMIEHGSKDPRVHYYRGILSEQLGADASDDFKAAAKLEIASGRSQNVNLALEKTQGSLRAKIEAIRELARAAAKSDPVAARAAILYREGVIALKVNDANSALAKFEEAIQSGGKDPRLHYLRGAALVQTGNQDAAIDSFRQGLSGETTARDARAVSDALQIVSNDIRQMIEEQVVVTRGDQTITRQANLRAVLKKEKQEIEQLLAAESASAAELLAQSEQSRVAREQEAAARILDEERKQAEAAALLRAAAETPAVTQPAERPASTPMPQSPAVASANPFGGDVQKPAEAPDPAATGPVPANPFLSGNASASGATGSASSVSPGPIETSWLAPNTEILVYMRPGEMFTSRFMTPLTELPPVQQSMGQMARELGFSMTEIDSVTFGMGDVMMAAMGIAAQAGQGGPPDGQKIAQQFLSNKSAISVFRTVNDVDFPATAKTHGGTEASHGGKTYYKMPSTNPGQQQTMVYVVDARTLLMTPSEGAMHAALDRGAGSASNEQFAFVSRSSHFVFAFSSPTLAAMSGGIPDPQGAPPFVGELVNAIRGQLGGVAISMHMTADLNLDVLLNIADSSAGADAAKALTGGIGMLQGMYPGMKASVPPDLQPVTDSAVASAAASFSEPVAKVSITIPGSLVTIIQQNPALLGPLGPGGMSFGPPGANPSAGFGDPSAGFGAPPGVDPGQPLQPAPAQEALPESLTLPGQAVPDPSAAFGTPPATTPNP